MQFSKILILVILIFLSSLFAGSETAMVSIRSTKVTELRKKKVRNSKTLHKLKKKPHRLLITILLANNITIIAASAYASFIFTEIYGSAGVGITTGIMTLVLLIFGDIIPKSFAHSHPIKVSLLMSKPIYVLQILLYPLVWLFTEIANLTGEKKNFNITEGELLAMLNIASKQGSILQEEKQLIENIFEFNDIKVQEVMTHRENIDALSNELSLAEAINKAKKHTHAKMLVYQNDLDNIIGLVTINQLLKFLDKYGKNKKLHDLKFIPAPRIDQGKKINIISNQFRRKKINIAVVVDENDRTVGLVTLEDLLEEIVGEISDKLV